MRHNILRVDAAATRAYPKNSTYNNQPSYSAHAAPQFTLDNGNNQIATMQRPFHAVMQYNYMKLHIF